MKRRICSLLMAVVMVIGMLPMQAFAETVNSPWVWIEPEDPEYHTAIRLLEILKLVLPIPSYDVPKLSILREFIGGGYFE